MKAFDDELFTWIVDTPPDHFPKTHQAVAEYCVSKGLPVPSIRFIRRQRHLWKHNGYHWVRAQLEHHYQSGVWLMIGGENGDLNEDLFIEAGHYDPMASIEFGISTRLVHLPGLLVEYEHCFDILSVQCEEMEEPLWPAKVEAPYTPVFRKAAVIVELLCAVCRIRFRTGFELRSRHIGHHVKEHLPELTQHFPECEGPRQIRPHQPRPVSSMVWPSIDYYVDMECIFCHERARVGWPHLKSTGDLQEQFLRAVGPCQPLVVIPPLARPPW